MKIDKRTTEGKRFLEDVSFNTRQSKHGLSDALRHASKLILDPDQKQRESESECLYCHYRSILAGSAFTSYTCQLCKNEAMYHNTATPKLCSQCAQDNDLCIRCGSEMYKRHEAHI